MKIFYTPLHRQHNPNGVLMNGWPFVSEEVPERVEVIFQAVQGAGLGPVEAPGDHGLEPILAVHRPEFVDYLQTIYTDYAAYYGREMAVVPETFAARPIRYRSRHVDARKGAYCFGVGSPILAGTWSAAYWSAQCALSAGDRLVAGDPAAYALCRPPGHHAAADLYGGFCYLNNAAVLARALNARVAILDIDYHHGNGTQEIFYSDPGVYYASLHAHPDDDYPYFWGGEDERGEGPGEGANRNWPLRPGTDDRTYIQVLEQALEEIDRFHPIYLVLSAGLDIGQGDPVGGFNITTAGFRQIGRLIASLGLPTAIVQEGGYQIEHLGERALALLEAFTD